MTQTMINRPVTLQTHLREQHNANPESHEPHDGCNGTASGEWWPNTSGYGWSYAYFTWPMGHSRWNGEQSVPCDCAADHYHS